MAQRRMFAKSITNSSRFLMMPQSSQNLYFHLGMNADDDGFCEHFTIMRMTESKPDDLKVLQAKGFVRVFDDKVLVVMDWRENNYIQKDRYTPSKYLEIYKEELKLLSDSKEQIPQKCIQNGYTGKVRLGKVRIDKVNNDTKVSLKAEHGNEDINYLLALLKAEYEIKLLDGSEKENRRYCWLALKKFKRSGVEAIIKIGARDKFWQTRITGFKTLYHNGVKIASLLKTRHQEKINIIA